jgi:uncharacterized lipoprotein YddW (UPF0748 family)
MDNCMASGCDVKTWMSASGYVDYIAPQIYWTDQWGSSGKTKMYSERLALWKKYNKNGTTMLIGLALYNAGYKISGDAGWGRKKTNLKEQVQKLSIKSKSVTPGCIELNFEVRLKDDGTEFINRLADMPGISHTVMVSYNGDYMS